MDVADDEFDFVIVGSGGGSMCAAVTAAALGLRPLILEIDAGRLATVDRFKGFVRSGKDEDFGRGDSAYNRFLGDKAHKPSSTLGSLEAGPFYAYRMYPGDVGTYGGVITDVHARVLRGDGTVIAGLYATGTSTASVMGRSYPGAGASAGPSFVWGYVAAKHAASAEETR